MENLLSQFIAFITPLGNHFIYFFLFISSVFENIFPPAPGDTIAAFGAFLAGTGRLNFFLVYLASTAGSVAGFMILFFFGKFLEREFFIKRNYSFFSTDKIEAVEKWFIKYGYIIIFLNRFLPGLRSVVSIASGFCGLKTVPVFFLSLISAMVWNFLWIYAGFAIGNNWETVSGGISRLLSGYNYTAGAVIIIVSLFFILRYFIRKKSSN